MAMAAARQMLHGGRKAMRWSFANSGRGFSKVASFLVTGVLPKKHPVEHRLVKAMHWPFAHPVRHFFSEEVEAWMMEEERMGQLNSWPEVYKLFDVVKDSGRPILAVQLHIRAIKFGAYGSIHVGTELMKLYGDMSQPAFAQGIFDDLPIKNIVAWTALIGVYRKMDVDRCSLVFGSLAGHGLQPNDVTYSAIIAAYAHAGCRDRAWEVLPRLLKDYGYELLCSIFIMPNLIKLQCARKEPSEVARWLRLFEEDLEELSLRDCFGCLLNMAGQFLDLKTALDCYFKLDDMDPSNEFPHLKMSRLLEDVGLSEEAKAIRDKIPPRVHKIVD